MGITTNVYIDGFNLYYGALKDTPHKWLHIGKLCATLLPKHHIQDIHYFSAHISSRLNDPSAPVRQQMYLRALGTIPNVTSHFGQFTSHERYLPRAGSLPDKTEYVKVIRTDEKGTDVNLATQLLCDAYEQKFECAVVISNDSDLLTPIRVVKERLKKKVGVVNPHKRASKQLRDVAVFYKQLRGDILASCQFDLVLQDSTGVFSKPTEWNSSDSKMR